MQRGIPQSPGRTSQRMGKKTSGCFRAKRSKRGSPLQRDEATAAAESSSPANRENRPAGPLVQDRPQSSHSRAPDASLPFPCGHAQDSDGSVRPVRLAVEEQGRSQEREQRRCGVPEAPVPEDASKDEPEHQRTRSGEEEGTRPAREQVSGKAEQRQEGAVLRVERATAPDSVVVRQGPALPGRFAEESGSGVGYGGRKAEPLRKRHRLQVLAGLVHHQEAPGHGDGEGRQEDRCGDCYRECAARLVRTCHAIRKET